jgi:hypothetical protein
MMSKKKNEEAQAGYTLVAVLLFVMVTAFAGASAAGVLGNSIQTMSITNTRTEEYFRNEKVFGEAVQWMRDNSTGMTDVFGRTKFYSAFKRRPPSVGSNDQGNFQVPTKIAPRTEHEKSIILVSDPILLHGGSNSGAQGSFPLTTDTKSGAAFDSLSALKTSHFSGKKIRITLVDAIPVDPAKDYGDAGVPPQTDFQPLYRIDVFDREKVSRGDAEGPQAGTSSRTFFKDKGGHLFGHVLGKLHYDYGVGFYGRDQVEIRQPCDSYISNSGPYSQTSARPHCPIGSNGPVSILNSTAVYGSVHTNNAISALPPFGGRVCANAACSEAGTTCQGDTCQVPGLPNFSAWNTYCPSNQGATIPVSGSLLTVSGNDPMQKCWSKVRIANNRVVTLTSTEYPYFIDELDISNTGRLNFAPSPATGTITLYVRKITGDSFNGNQVFNVNNKPYQLRLNYLGVDRLRLNGTADMSTFIIAPSAAIEVLGNFVFRGGIKATALTFNGNGSLHYDESGDITTLKGISYQFRNVTQFYRQ